MNVTDSVDKNSYKVWMWRPISICEQPMLVCE